MVLTQPRLVLSISPKSTNIIMRGEPFDPSSHERVITQEKIVDTINLNSLFNDETKKTKNILITNANSAVSQYIISQWSKKKLWFKEFEHVMRVDLSDMVKNKSSLSNTSPKELFAILVHKFVKNSKISMQEVNERLKTKKILIILENFEKVNHLLNNHQYDYINKVLELAYSYNSITLSQDNDHNQKHIQHEIVLTNINLYSNDIHKHLKLNLSKNDNYKNIVAFFRNNQNIMEISSDQNILIIISNFLKNSEKTSLSEVYNNLVFQMVIEHLDHSHFISHAEVFSSPIIKFIKLLSFHASSNNGKIQNEYLNELLIQYNELISKQLGQSITAIEAAKLFGFIDSKNIIDGDIEYSFVHNSIQDFFSALYLKDQLLNKLNIESAKSFITSKCNDEDYFLIMKFLPGVIKLHSNEPNKITAIENIFSSIIHSNKDVIQIAGDNKVKLIIHMLSQIDHDLIDKSKFMYDLAQHIDDIIINDLYRWHIDIINTQYSSQAILNRLISNLESNENIALLSIKILPLLNLNSEQKDKVKSFIIKKIHSDDTDIAENAIQALKYLISPETKLALLNAMDDVRTNIKIVAIETASKVANEEIVNKLLSLLYDNDKWVVFAAISAIGNLKHFNILEENIITSLVQKFSKINYEDNFLLEKIIKVLKIYQLDIKDLISEFENQLSSSNEQIQIDAINGLKNLKIRISPEQLEHIYKLIYDSYNYIRSPASYLLKLTGHKNKAPIKTAIIEALTKIGIGSNKETEINTFLMQHAASNELIIRHTCIKWLAILSANNPLTYTYLLDRINNPELSNAAKIVKIEAVTISYKSLEDSNKEHFIQSIISLQDSSHDKDLTITIIKTLAKLFFSLPESIKQRCLDKIIFNAVNPSESYSQSVSIKALVDIFRYLNEEQKFTVQKIITDNLDNAIQNIREAAILANKMISFIINKDVGYKPNLEKLSASELNIKLQNNINTINELSNMYINNSIETELNDQITINNLFDAILFFAINTNSKIMHMRLSNLLKRADYSDITVFNVLDILHPSENKIQASQTVKTLLGNKISLELETKLHILQRQDEDIAKKYPDLESITSNLDEFAEYVNQNHLDLQLTRKALTVNQNQYALNSNIDQIKTIAKTLIHPYHSLSYSLNKLPNSNIKSIFDSDINLDDNIRLSILYKTTLNNILKHIILIIEEKTIFGDALVHKIILNDSNHEIIVSSSENINYLKDIFGEHTDTQYYISTGIINIEERNKILNSLSERNTKESMLEYLSSSFKFIKDSLENDNWKNSASITHNELIRYTPLEERIESIEHKIFNLEEEATKIKISYESIAKIQTITQYNKLKDSDEIAQRSFTIYQKSLYHTIVRELIQLHTAATVVQTEMVQNSERGFIGSIGSLFSKISPHVPMAGAAIDLFGYILGIVDQEIQSRSAEKILLLADDPVSMTKLAREFALKVATTNFNANKIKDSNLIFDNIKAAIHLTEDIKTNIIRKIVDLSLSQHDPKISEEKARGQTDAKIIVTKLIAMIIAGNCDLSDDTANKLDVLNQFFIDNYVEISIFNQIDPPLTTEINFHPSPTRPSMPASISRGLSVEIPPLLTRSTSLPIAKSLETNNRARSLSDSSIIIAKQKSLDEMESQQSERSPNSDSFFSVRYAISSSLDSIESPRYNIDRDLIDSSKALVPIKTYDSKTSTQYNHNNPYLIQNTPERELDIGTYGGILMNGVEIISPIKYIINQCTPIGYLTRNWHIEETIAPFEHYIYSGLHILGNTYYTYYYDIDPITSFFSSLTFAAKPQLYSFRDKVLNSIKESDTNDLGKFITYIATDTLMSLSIASPFITTSSPYPVVYFALRGLIDGSINFFNSEKPPTNTILGEIASAGTTGFALYSCYKLVNIQEDILFKIIAVEAYIPVIASTHYYSKLITNTISEAAQRIFIGDSENKMEMEN